jgi:hypothetical protein
VGNRIRTVKAQDDDVDMTAAQELLDGGRCAGHNGAERDLSLARSTAQLDRRQIKATGDGAHTPLLLVGQVAVEDEHVEATFLRKGKKASADRGGELRRHLERPEARNLLRASCGRSRVRMRGRERRREGGEGDGEEKHAARSGGCGSQQRLARMIGRPRRPLSLDSRDADPWSP